MTWPHDEYVACEAERAWLRSEKRVLIVQPRFPPDESESTTQSTRVLLHLTHDDHDLEVAVPCSRRYKPFKTYELKACIGPGDARPCDYVPYPRGRTLDDDESCVD